MIFKLFQNDFYIVYVPLANVQQIGHLIYYPLLSLGESSVNEFGIIFT